MQIFNNHVCSLCGSFCPRHFEILACNKNAPVTINITTYNCLRNFIAYVFLKKLDAWPVKYVNLHNEYLLHIKIYILGKNKQYVMA